MSATEAARQIASKLTAPGTPTSRLGAAAQQENDRFIGSEGDRQQMVMRYVTSLCCACYHVPPGQQQAR